MDTILKILTALWRLFTAFLFYPLMLGLLVWLVLSDSHWVWGLMVLIIILVIDPVWMRILRYHWDRLRHK